MAKRSGLGRVFPDTTPDKRKPKVLGKRGKMVHPRRALPGWYIEWRDKDGRPHKEKGGDTQAEARRALEARLAEVREARNSNTRRIDHSKIKLDALLETYAEARKHKVTKEHLDEVKSSFGKMLEAVGAVYVAELDANRVQAYLNRILETGRAKGSDGPKTGSAPRTANKHLAYWKAVLNRAAKMMEIEFNPIAAVEPFKKGEIRRVRRELSESEIVSFLQAAQRPDAKEWEHVAYGLALYTALRQGEVAALERRDVDFENCCFHIRAETTKSKEKADLPMHPFLSSMLRNWQERHPGTPKAKVVKMSSAPVTELKKTLVAAGIPYCNDSDQYVDWHSLRHTCLTHLERLGCDPKSLQAIARHADLKTTMNFYVHRSREREADAIRRLPNYVAVDEAASMPMEGTTGAAIAPGKAFTQRSGAPTASKSRSTQEVTTSGKTDFESGASASSATPAVAQNDTISGSEAQQAHGSPNCPSGIGAGKRTETHGNAPSASEY